MAAISRETTHYVRHENHFPRPKFRPLARGGPLCVRENHLSLSISRDRPPHWKVKEALHIFESPAFSRGTTPLPVQIRALTGKRRRARSPRLLSSFKQNRTSRARRSFIQTRKAAIFACFQMIGNNLARDDPVCRAGRSLSSSKKQTLSRETAPLMTTEKPPLPFQTTCYLVRDAPAIECERGSSQSK